MPKKGGKGKMKIQNITTAYNFNISQGYTEIIVINITEGTPENFVPYQTEDIYLISNNCSEFDNVPIYFEIMKGKILKIVKNIKDFF